MPPKRKRAEKPRTDGRGLFAKARKHLNAPKKGCPRALVLAVTAGPNEHLQALADEINQKRDEVAAATSVKIDITPDLLK
eukprot:80250-Pyramimonas_sp.AAC.1